MRNYTDFIVLKKIKYGSRFNSSDLAPQFIPYYNSQLRIEVGFTSGGKIYEKKWGTVGVTTGWKPVFLLMLTKRSLGSSYILRKEDVILRFKA